MLGITYSARRVQKKKSMMIHSRTALAERFFSGNSATYEQIANFSSLGLDGWWKRKIVSQIPHNPTRILDQACGTGLLTFRIAQRFPHCRILGVDLQDEYLGIAKEKARALELTTVEFIHGKVEDVVLEGDFDCVTSCYLAKYADLTLLVNNAHEMLREGGMLIMHELTYPTRALYALFWHIHFKFLQAYGTWKYPEWRIALDELPACLKETVWIDELVDALKANKFSDINIEYLAFGASAIVSARK
ncbi:MAG: methyltransferase domain-containing protein [Verrucomicrobia bacterium]|nr:methyltransferase domain-containing protein [Verrucomicrobiota bacterium]